jgi:hypothetical protein
MDNILYHASINAYDERILLLYIPLLFQFVFHGKRAVISDKSSGSKHTPVDSEGHQIEVQGNDLLYMASPSPGNIMNINRYYC